MVEFLNGEIKNIAFYLPQFHSIPENDEYWGTGFTEWTNVKKAQPLFTGHQQPKVPYDNNYYDLMEQHKETMLKQVCQAKEYGVDGFCYYHYWFKDGKKLLEKPIELMLNDDDIQIPFCLSWANENWTKNWDGGNKETIVEQNYGAEHDWKNHFYYLLDFFQDDRYIKFNSKPVFVIYKPELIPDLDKMLLYWEDLSKKEGLAGICFLAQNPSWILSPFYNSNIIKYQILFQPAFSWYSSQKNWSKLSKAQYFYNFSKKIQMDKAFKVTYEIFKKLKNSKTSGSQALTKYDYDVVWKNILSENYSKHFIAGAFVDWDNTPRKKDGMLHIGATPEKFGNYMTKLYRKIDNEGLLPVVFINAWNEWAEGAFLEPDKKHGFEYLKALKKSKESW